MQSWFEVEYIDNHAQISDPKNSVVVIGIYDHDWKEQVLPYKEQGCKIVCERFWEMPFPNYVKNSVLILSFKDFFRCNEALWYKHLGYDCYVPNASIKNKNFLMLMNLKKPHRDQIYKMIQPIIDHSLHSYVGVGKHLPDDADPSESQWQRYFNPKWYDSCNFSVVVESSVVPVTFVTEKTYKPLAFFHPFIIYGTPGSLTHLRSQGFETFKDWIDETYDDENSAQIRLQKIINEIFQLVDKLQKDPTMFSDKKMHQLLQHNYETFYNIDLCKQLIYKGTVVPILNHLGNL